MKIYLAGNGAIPKRHLAGIYKLLKHRLFTYFEIEPNGFSRSQWFWIINKKRTNENK